MSENAAIDNKSQKEQRRGRLFFMILFCLCITFLWIDHTVGIHAAPQNGHRSLSSMIAKNKDSVLKFHSANGLVHTEKLAPPIHIRLASDEKTPLSNGEKFELTGTISVTSTFAQATVHWMVPKDGIEIVSGSTDTTLFNLSPGHPQTVQILLKTTTTSNRRIHLSVQAKAGKSVFGDVATFNTVSQKTTASAPTTLQKSSVPSKKGLSPVAPSPLKIFQ